MPLRRRTAMIEALEARTLLSTNVVGYHNDHASTGQNLTETLLTPGNVKVATFGKQFSTPLDGQAYAQPLYVAGVDISTGAFAGAHDAVFVATQKASLYAIDADGGNVLWKTSFLSAQTPGVALPGATSIATVPSADVGSGDISPQIGITGTPVIDVAHDALYVITKTKQIVAGKTHYVAAFFKVDTRDGSVIASKVIADTAYTGGVYTYRTNANPLAPQDPFTVGSGVGAVAVGGQSRVYFNALRQLSRPGLVLRDGVVYSAWASHGDNGPYHGWVLGIDADTLDYTAVFNTTPNGTGGGIWQGGGITSVDDDGNFYFETGNGTFDGDKNAAKQTIGLDADGFPNQSNYGDVFLKVALDATTSAGDQGANGWGMEVVDYFSPFNNHALDVVDRDLGSSGPLVLPDAVGSVAHPHLLLGSGKEGKIYLIDRDDLGKFNPFTDRVVQEQASTLSGVLNTAAYFFDGTTHRAYFVPGYNNDRAKSYTLANGAFSPAPTGQSPDTFGYLGGSPSVSADGATNGIVWAIDTGSASLRAYSASNLAQELWTSNQAPGGRDTLGTALKFTVPTVADGEVFVGTMNALVAYGPPTIPDHAPEAPTDAAATAPNFHTVTVTWVDAADNEDYFSIQRSTDNVTFAEVGTAGVNAQTYTDTVGLLSQTTYYYRVVAHNFFEDGTDSAPSNAVTILTPLPPLDGGGDGLAAAYFNDAPGRHLAGTPALTRVDPQVNFVFGTASPGPGVNADLFSVRWTGRVQAQYTQTYTFYTVSDDGVRLFIKPTAATTWTTLVDNFTNHGSTENSGTFAMSGGATYDVRMEYYENVSGATAKLLWSSASTPKQVIPKAQLYSGTAPTPPGRLRVVPGSGTQFNLTWNDTSTTETGFLLRRVNPDKTLTNVMLPAGTRSYMDAGLTPGTTYTYRLRATNFAADSAFTPDVVLTTPIAPPTPSGGRVTAATPTTLSIAWKLNSTKPSNRETAVTISRKTGQGGFFQIIAELPPGTTAYTDLGPGGAGLKPGTFYDYHVQASNAAGYSDFTGANTTTQLSTADKAPPAVIVTAAPKVRTAGGTFYDFTVRYTDPSGVDLASIDDGDFGVTGPGGFSAGVDLRSATPSNGGRTVDARYRLTAPGGAWDLADNGVYTLTLRRRQVDDLAGNAIAAGVVGQFTVSIAPAGRRVRR